MTYLFNLTIVKADSSLIFLQFDFFSLDLSLKMFKTDFISFTTLLSFIYIVKKFFFLFFQNDLLSLSVFDLFS